MLIETELRSVFSYIFSKKYGPIGYKNIENFRDIPDDTYEKIIFETNEHLEKNGDLVYQHHKDKYDGELPLWAYVEYLSFGNLVSFITYAENDILLDVSHHFGIDKNVIISYLNCIRDLRNRCAHEDRIYNKKLSKSIKFTRFLIGLLDGYKISKTDICNTVFSAIYAIFEFFRYSKNIQIKFMDELMHLLLKFPLINMSNYGFPKKWFKIIDVDEQMIDNYKKLQTESSKKIKKWIEYV